MMTATFFLLRRDIPEVLGIVGNWYRQSFASHRAGGLLVATPRPPCFVDLALAFGSFCKPYLPLVRTLLLTPFDFIWIVSEFMGAATGGDVFMMRSHGAVHTLRRRSSKKRQKLLIECNRRCFFVEEHYDEAHCVNVFSANTNSAKLPGDLAQNIRCSG